MTIKEKICSVCGEPKELNSFGKLTYVRKRARTTRTILKACCRTCERLKLLKFRQNNREKLRKDARKRRLEDPKYQLLVGARTRARKHKLPFAITKADIKIPSLCPALGIELKIGKRKPLPNSPSLDRIDPAQGYVPGNIVVISLLANRIKYTVGYEEIQAVANFVRALNRGQKRLYKMTCDKLGKKYVPQKDWMSHPVCQQIIKEKRIGKCAIKHW